MSDRISTRRIPVIGPAVLVTCEHACNRLPDSLAPASALGVAASVLASHVAWDAGAHAAGAALATLLGCPYIAGAYTRLYVDLNRSPDTSAVVPHSSFGVALPGNARLSPGERAARIATHHQPHWQRVITAIDAGIASAGACLHLAVHSFAPDLDPHARRFDIGVLYDPERPWETLCAASLARSLSQAGYQVRHNQPYLGTDDGLTTAMRLRFRAHAYTGIELELSQALATAPGRAPALPAAVADAVRAARTAQPAPR